MRSSSSSSSTMILLDKMVSSQMMAMMILLLIGASFCSIPTTTAFSFTTRMAASSRPTKIIGSYRSLSSQPTTNHWTVLSHPSCSTATTTRLHMNYFGQNYNPYSGQNNDDPDNNNEDDNPNDEGEQLAAQFFNQIKSRPDIEKLLDDVDDLEDGLDELGEDFDDDESVGQDFPIGQVNVFRGRDDGAVGKLAGNVTLTNRNLYSNLKDRVLESPKAFVDYVGGADASEQMEFQERVSDMIYVAPSLIPNPELTAGEVVELVLKALNHNNEGPSSSSDEINYGVQVLFAYSSDKAYWVQQQMSIDEYAEFLSEAEYAPLLNHNKVIIDKADYSHDKQRAFYSCRIRPSDSVDKRRFTSVNFILSKQPESSDESDYGNDCWLIDSLVVRTEGLGRNRRRK